MKKGDFVVVLLLLISSIIFLFFLSNTSNNNHNIYASIQLDGKEIRRVDFNSNEIGEKIRIDSKYGYNILEVGDKKIRSIESDCKEKIHIKQGWISKPGQVLVCLPHKLVVEIKTDDEQVEIDHINF